MSDLSTYPLRLPRSIRAGVERLSKQDGVSINQFVSIAVAEKEMLTYKHSGFSVDAGVCIEAHDRAALERLLPYCARPPFAMDRLRTSRCRSGVPLWQTAQRACR